MTIDRVAIYGTAAVTSSLAYVLLAVWKRKVFPHDELGRVVSCFLNGPGIVAAALIMKEGFAPSAQFLAIGDVGELRFYLILGGFSFGWVNLSSLSKDLRAAMSVTIDAGRGPAQSDAEKTDPDQRAGGASG